MTCFLAAGGFWETFQLLGWRELLQEAIVGAITAGCTAAIVLWRTRLRYTKELR